MPVPSAISTRMQYQHKSLLDTIEGLSDEEIRRNTISGKWSIFENTVHLQTYQHVFAYHMKEILSGNNPCFEQYSAANDPFFPDNCRKSTREIMQDMLGLRKEMAYLVNHLSEEDLEKTGIHHFYGKMNLLQWINFFLLHEAHHLFTIFKLSAELKKEQVFQL